MTERAGKMTIAISRQMGSGGSYIGYLVARRLRFTYVDREILRKAAQHLGTDTALLEEREERSSGLMGNIATIFSYGALDAVYTPPIHRAVYDRDLFTAECKVMNEIVDRYNAVIIGRGGFYALRARPEVLRVLIHAPIGFRLERVMKVQRNADPREVKTKVEESDRRRGKFLRDMTGVEWTDARNYHLSIDSSAVGFDTSVRMILDLAANWPPAQA